MQGLSSKGLKQIGERFVLKVAVINRKGGQGRTTITANLGGELAARGLNVGLVDTDAQGESNLAIVFGLKPEDGLFKVMVGVLNGEDDNRYRRLPVTDVARLVRREAYCAEKFPLGVTGNLFVLPAAKKTFLIPSLMDDDAGLFGDVLDDFAHTFDLQVILIDTGASMNFFDGSIYDAADAFLHITEAETLALVGIAGSFEQIERRNKRRRAAGGSQANLLPKRVLGIVPNKTGGLKEHADNLKSLGDAFGADLIWQPIRRLKAYPQMANRGQIVRAYAPSGPEAEQMTGLVEQFEKAVTTWLVH